MFLIAILTVAALQKKGSSNYISSLTRTYHLKIEIYEIWSTGEKLCQTTREITVKYVPQTRQSRLIKIPFVKSVTGTDLAVISNQDKQIYLDIEKAAKKEQLSRRNEQ